MGSRGLCYDGNGEFGDGIQGLWEWGTWGWDAGFGAGRGETGTGLQVTVVGGGQWEWPFPEEKNPLDHGNTGIMALFFKKTPLNLLFFLFFFFSGQDLTGYGSSLWWHRFHQQQQQKKITMHCQKSRKRPGKVPDFKEKQNEGKLKTGNKKKEQKIPPTTASMWWKCRFTTPEWGSSLLMRLEKLEIPKNPAWIYSLPVYSSPGNPFPSKGTSHKWHLHPNPKIPRDSSRGSAGPTAHVEHPGIPISKEKLQHREIFTAWILKLNLNWVWCGLCWGCAHTQTLPEPFKIKILILHFFLSFFSKLKFQITWH